MLFKISVQTFSVILHSKETADFIFQYEINMYVYNLHISLYGHVIQHMYRQFECRKFTAYGKFMAYANAVYLRHKGIQGVKHSKC